MFFSLIGFKADLIWFEIKLEMNSPSQPVLSSLRTPWIHTILLNAKIVFTWDFWMWEERAQRAWAAIMMSHGPYPLPNLNAIQIKDKEIRRKEICYVWKEGWCQIIFFLFSLKSLLAWERYDFFLTPSPIFGKHGMPHIDVVWSFWHPPFWPKTLMPNYLKGVQ